MNVIEKFTQLQYFLLIDFINIPVTLFVDFSIGDI